MKNPRPIVGILLILGLVFLAASCISVPARAAQPDGRQTYAIIAVDDHGVLTQADQEKIRRSLVQYLTDQGYVQRDQVLTDDVVHADVVFRVMIAWQDAGTRFAITEVVPSYSAAGLPSDYAAESPPPAVPWSYDNDYYDDGYLGYAYSPFTPYWAFFPFIPYYEFRHHRSPPPYVNHPPPPKGPPGKHHPPRWKGHTGYTPWRPDAGSRPLPGMRPRRPQRPPVDGRRSLPPSSSWHSRTTDSHHRSVPPNSPVSRPLQPDSDHRPPHSTGRPPSWNQGSNHRPPPPNPSASNVRNPGSTMRPAPAPSPRIYSPPVRISSPPASSPRPAPPPPVRSNVNSDTDSGMKAQQR
ncbi:MAG: hypothetical protein PHE83_06580 [Opitutaceae bacterium]|nr:hypothetical protein [Opitutaceae bacterium]